MSKDSTRNVKRRGDRFAAKAKTKLWCEKPAKDNPYIAATVLCQGYDLFDLVDNCSFVEVLFLLFRGRIPTASESRLLECLMIGLINPGPRHPAGRAAMNAAVGKTNPVHILPIAASVMGGENNCAGAIERCMRFYRKHIRQPVDTLLADCEGEFSVGNWSGLPGFGQTYGGIDLQTAGLAERILAQAETGDVLRWGQQLAQRLRAYAGGWLSVGLAAAVFSDLGFKPQLGGPLYQLLTAPGLIAQGMEYASKPLTAMPYVEDAHYAIENQA